MVSRPDVAGGKEATRLAPIAHRIIRVEADAGCSPDCWAATDWDIPPGVQGSRYQAVSLWEEIASWIGEGFCKAVRLAWPR